MVTRQDIDKWLYKNVSYLFSIPLYDIVFHDTYSQKEYQEISKYVINTYAYNEKDNYFTILLKSDIIDIFEYYISYNKLIGYVEHEFLGNYITVKLKKNMYLPKDLLTCLESNNYSNIINTETYKNFISKQKNYTNNLQRQIVEKNDDLLTLLKEKFNTDVNGYWKKYIVEEETLTLQKIKDMNTNLTIQKNWILTKIKNSDIVSKVAYEDVLNNAIEIIAPSIIALGKQPDIDYEKIYNSVKEALIKKCGKPQYQLDIRGSKYPLMCNYQDFKTKLSKVIKKYKLEDIKKITNILIDHINKLQSPLLKYFIEKDNNSDLASAYECYVESKPIVNKIETKKLF